MSLSELIPLINNLSQSDKLSLFKLLAAQVPDAELQAIFSASEYPVWSPYDATEAVLNVKSFDVSRQDLVGSVTRERS
jgi:hypothetical protein